MWYHATNNSGGLPTDIYHATSSNLLLWNVTVGPVLRHLGDGSFEFDQVAGPVPFTRGDTAFMYTPSPIYYYLSLLFYSQPSNSFSIYTPSPMYYSNVFTFVHAPLAQVLRRR